MKTRFALIGAGWRAMYYVRIAKALPDQFECVGILCRSKEKADAIQQRHHIHAVTTPEEITALRPDLVVVAVTKASIAEVSMEWIQRGFLVVSETPAALDIDTLNRLWNVSEHGRRLIVAEQYRYYPENIARKNLLYQNLLGDPQYLLLSLAHDYHAMSLMRYFLGISCNFPYSVTASAMGFPTIQTMTRQEIVQDGSMIQAERKTALFRFESDKAALYEFDSEQYRSSIRSNLIKIQGVSGELINDHVQWLDEKYQPHSAPIKTMTRIVETDDPNPNFHCFLEVTGIQFLGKPLYEPPFGTCGLSQDETAIATLLKQASTFQRGEQDAPYSLKEALTDAAMAIDLQKAIETGTVIHSDQTLPWY